MSNSNEVLNDLFDYIGYKIYQIKGNFKFSLDSILLAEYTKVKRNTKFILDMCTGNAPIPLILTTKTNASIDAVEIQENIAKLATKSVIYNNKQNQINIINADINEIDNYIFNKKYDIITCNPPFFKVDNYDFTNKYEGLSLARHEIKIDLERIFMIASNHLNDKGEFYMVHRVSRLDEIIIMADKYNLRVKNITLVKTKESERPSILLIRCVKSSKYGIKIQNTLNIENLKTYQNLFKEEL